MVRRYRTRKTRTRRAVFHKRDRRGRIRDVQRIGRSISSDKKRRKAKRVKRSRRTRGKGFMYDFI